VFPNKRRVGDVENFCRHVLQTNWEILTREFGLLLRDHRAELLKAAVNAEKRGGMLIDDVGAEFVCRADINLLLG
jgi:hypothetical protein